MDAGERSPGRPPSPRSLPRPRSRAVLAPAPHGSFFRHRRPPERRQDHALQRALGGQGRGGQLPLLHDRAERRRRRRARPAPRGARPVVHAERIVPTTINFVDIAGPRARRVQGRGPRQPVPRHIREVDAIVQVARCFEDPNVIHVENRVDPVADIATVTTELCLKDLDTVQQARSTARARWRRRTSRSRSSRSRSARRSPSTSTAASRRARFSAARRRSTRRPIVREMQLLTAKPAFYIANVDEGALANLDGEQALPGARATLAKAEGAPHRPRLRRARGADRRARSGRAPRVPRERGPQGARAQRRHPRRLRAPRAPHVLHRRQAGGPRLDDHERRARPAGGRRHPHRLREGLHQGRGHLVGGLREARRRSEVPRGGQARDRGQGVRDARRRRRALPLQRLTPDVDHGCGRPVQSRARDEDVPAVQDALPEREHVLLRRRGRRSSRSHDPRIGTTARRALRHRGGASARAGMATVYRARHKLVDRPVRGEDHEPAARAATTSSASASGARRRARRSSLTRTSSRSSTRARPRTAPPYIVMELLRGQRARRRRRAGADAARARGAAS